jgi:hypothetical protein
LLAQGKHPHYTKGELADTYIAKMMNIENEPLKYEFPTNFSPLATDFFLKLCSNPPSKRYSANIAL